MLHVTYLCSHPQLCTLEKCANVGSALGSAFGYATYIEIVLTIIVLGAYVLYLKWQCGKKGLAQPIHVVPGQCEAPD